MEMKGQICFYHVNSTPSHPSTSTSFPNTARNRNDSLDAATATAGPEKAGNVATAPKKEREEEDSIALNDTRAGNRDRKVVDSRQCTIPTGDEAFDVVEPGLTLNNHNLGKSGKGWRS